MFNVKIDVREWQDKGVVPSVAEYMKHDVVLNYDDHVKGNVDLCVWKRQEEPAVITPDFIEREVTRILRTGVWVAIGDKVFWIPPNYYLFLQYFSTGGQPPQFRFKRLKHCYFKIEQRNNPHILGTYTIKNRQDGETTFAMNDVLWEAAEGNMDFGSMGMQSKTRDTVMHSCWRTLIMGWNSLPAWLKNAIFYDFTSGDKTAETMKFVRQASEGDRGRNVLIAYGASTHNAFDSFNNMRRCILDEVNKWEECSFYATFLNYKQFIAAGSSRKGLFDIFSSPADKNGRHNEEAFQFWQKSDTANMVDGTTESRVARYYSNPLEGIEGFYDKWGDADPDKIYRFIMRERDSVPADKKMGEIRAYPLNEAEMFGSTEGSSVWDNAEGIENRKVFLMGAKYKDPATREPVRVFGNLERVDGYADGDVFFRPADVNKFDVHKARWCFSHLPPSGKVQELRDIFTPPKIVENCVGLDPFGKRHVQKRASNGAIVVHRFRDISGWGFNKIPFCLYLNRPASEKILYEDALKTAIFTRGRIQYESVTHGFGEYAEDRGYFKWLLPSRGEKEGSKKTGDSPSSRATDGMGGSFLDEGLALINALLNKPLFENDPYYLDMIWLYELLDDVSRMNPKDTHLNDATMAWIMAFIGSVKIMKAKTRRGSDANRLANGVLDYLVGI